MTAAFKGIDVAASLHIRSQRLKNTEHAAEAMVVRSFTVRISIAKTVRLRPIIGHFQCIGEDLHVLEIIASFIVKFIPKEGNDALAVGLVCPNKLAGVIVERVLHVPRFQTRVGKIGIALMLRSYGMLVQRRAVERGHDQVEGMPSRSRVVDVGGCACHLRHVIGAVDSRYKVRDAIQHTRHEIAAVT